MRSIPGRGGIEAYLALDVGDRDATVWADAPSRSRPHRVVTGLVRCQLEFLGSIMIPCESHGHHAKAFTVQNFGKKKHRVQDLACLTLHRSDFGRCWLADWQLWLRLWRSPLAATSGRRGWLGGSTVET
jgi:hypothetical protein